MAQLTPSTTIVTPTVGDDWENIPVNPQKVIQAHKTTATINGSDLTLYPAIKFTVDWGFKVRENKNTLPGDNSMYWIYAAGDTATRDLDFTDANDKIGESGGGGGTTSEQIISTSDSKVSLSYKFNTATKIVTVFDFDFKELASLSGMQDGDKLLILYNSNDTNEETDALIDILDEIRITNKLLKKIYK
jgi:hypothetical protein